MAPRSERGVAIIMVIAVLAGLMALAAPFVFSMILQERAARGTFNAMQAREGAEAAVAHGLAHLARNVRYDPADTRPFVTTLRDLKINMEFAGASKSFNSLNVNMQNPYGLLSSARIEDEQAKINLNSAPPALIGNLLASGLLAEAATKGATELIVDDVSEFYTDGDSTSTDGTVCVGGDWVKYKHVGGGAIYLVEPLQLSHPKGTLVYDGRARQIADYKIRDRNGDFKPFRSIYEVKTALNPLLGQPLAPDVFARIERMVTIHSGREGAVWGHAERPREQNFKEDLQQFLIEKGAGYSPGTLVRVVQAGVPRAYARVRAIGLQNNGSAFLQLDQNIGVNVSSSGQGDDVYLEPELKHPINLNTAAPEVIAAVVMGVCLKQGSEPVTRDVAVNLAQELTRGGIVYVDHQQLREALDKAHEKRILTAQQRDAIYINASEPNSPKLRTSTVPFCYHSCGSYTIEGSAVFNNDNGMQLSRHAVRQLVSMPTPWPGRFDIQNQLGFQELLDNGQGTRIVSGPVAMGRLRYQYGTTAPTPRLGSPNLGGVRLDVGQCAQKLYPDDFLEHCDNEADPAFRMDGYDMARREHFKIPQSLQPRNPVQNEPGSQPTSMELWYKPLSDAPVIFYDHGLEEDRNRVLFAYQPGIGLKLSIWDAGLEREAVEYLFPAQLTALDWYHIAASWKGSYCQGQEIRLDGLLSPRDNQRPVLRPGSKLASDISLEEVNELEIEDSEYTLPDKGAVRIGEEIIEYQLKNGNTLQQLKRGARMSAIAEHKAGEMVVPYGYSNRLGGILRVGGATLASAIRQGDISCRINRLPPPTDIGMVLDSDTVIKVNDASNFPPSGYVWSDQGELIYYGARDATNFRQVQRAVSANGASGPARNLPNNSSLYLFSIEVSDHSQYEQQGIVQIDDETDNTRVEWIRYGSKPTQNGKNYLLGEMWNNPAVQNPRYSAGNPPTTRNGPAIRPIYGFRGIFGIGGNRGHARGAKVIPVVRMQGPHCGDGASPYGPGGISTVSVVENGTTDGDLRYVKQAYTHQWADTNNDPRNLRFVRWVFDYYVGLDDFVSRDFPQASSRLLKFPSGELPDLHNVQRNVGADRNGEGKLGGYVDEIRVSTHPTKGARIAMTTAGTGIASADETIIVENYDAWPSNNPNNVQLYWKPNGGLIRINDEFIWYDAAAPAQIEYYADVWPNLKEQPPQRNKAQRMWVPGGNRPPELHPNIKQKQALQLTGCKRGLFNSEAKDHPPGALIMLCDGEAITCLNGMHMPTSDTISLRDGRGFPKEGYVWIGNEVISYQDGGGGGALLGCYPFHGAFGTTREAHEAGEVVRNLPFRYWDRAGEYYDGRGLALLQAGYHASDAVWDSVQIETKAVEQSILPSRCRPKILVRFDGKPGWDVEPLNQEGSLFMYEVKNNSPIRLTGAGGAGVKANQIEIRVYWDYQTGAFQLSQDWKRTFDLTRVRATYHSPMIMRRLDELERR